MKLNSNLVLCVDDEVIGLQVRKILLERAGYRVLTAADGPSGLEIFSAEPVEAVVLDASGNIYVGGSTASSNLPVVAPSQPASGGGADVFIFKDEMVVGFFGDRDGDRSLCVERKSEQQ